MLSFIIPAYNEQAWLGRCLPAIRAAMAEVEAAHEIIVVDDASTDATVSIAQSHGARAIRVEHRQISATRNAGAREARGDIFLFVDADTVVTGEVIRSALRALGHGEAGGGCVPRFEGELPFWFRALYPAMVFAMRRVLHRTGGAFLFCTRQGFEATGGFSVAHYAAEEDVWVKSFKRHGKFTVLAEPVVTSGRSLRTQSFLSIARVFLLLAVRGADGFRRREGLDLWYRPRREEK